MRPHSQGSPLQPDVENAVLAFSIVSESGHQGRLLEIRAAGRA